MTLFAYILAGFAVYLSAYVLYQTVLFAANAILADPQPLPPSRIRRLNVLIPAHDEELFLPRLLRSLVSQSYPRDHFRVTVIADNCSDGTVAAARQYDVDVLERNDPSQRGKGHAIRWALEQLPLDRFDAFIIVDGDSYVAAGFLQQLNLQLERGDVAIQCYNGVGNPGQSWFTRLMDVSRTISNEILHPAKRKLGLSSHLMGNGMCFDVRLLRAREWDAFSVGEDWEYYAHLILGGAYVGYSRFARVYHQESVNLRQASAQRLRWSSGRFQVLRRYGPSLLLQGLRTHDVKCIDAALPLAFPNPSLAMNLTIVGLVLAALYWLATASAGLLSWFSVLGLAQLSMFLVGVLHTRDKLASAASLVLAPLFLGWKLAIDVLSISGLTTREWKRTQRRLS